MWQAEHVKKLLNQKARGACDEILGLSTKGDEILNQSLSKIGGKGLFVKELEAAMLEKKAHLAVHSLKDVPMVLPDGFAIGAILVRETPSDAFISNKYSKFLDLPKNATVGTSSLRREFQLRLARPDINVLPLRGNLETRLKKLDEGKFDGIILAAAGLSRLGYGQRISEILDHELMVPAVGQGTIAVETLSNNKDLLSFLQELSDVRTTIEVNIERRIARLLGSSCQLPLAVFCQSNISQTIFHVRARLAMPNGTDLCEADLKGEDADNLSSEVFESLMAQGAQKVLTSLR
tara:strand:- start:16095 stop:16970 length:876 start_codon:yes stop_codon:yes gene_type:complete